MKSKKRINIKSGDKYGGLTVICESIIKIKKGREKYRRLIKCRCECGTVIIIRLDNIRSGHATSCGCKRHKSSNRKNMIHGLCYHILYKRWSNMKDRCYNPNARFYYCYGGRGITMCNEWLIEFKAFYYWAIKTGWRKDLELDRINNNGNYEPNNCRWVSKKENHRNKRNNVLYSIEGKNLCISEIAERNNINDQTLRARLKKGINIEDAIKPVKKR